ncbi:type I polyketide synthase [Amycolatopsis sp. NPDC026612]|uniref:type I polyketide synthase n=1 Tax=Amycolatopsis sp. NPDC026612 TaxID=3155466 RepID=UPI0033D8BE69
MNGYPESGTAGGGTEQEPVAVVGMACRYPDADDLTQLWQLVLDQRQAFRRLPPERLDLDDYFDRDRAAPDKTYGSMAALIEGWTFDRAAFRIPGPSYRATDPAHWLALETAARALADAGFPGGAGLDRDKVAVVVGNSLTGDTTRAATMRLRWPYVRRVLTSAITESGLSEQQRTALLDRAEEHYLAPFPPVGDETLAGGLANTIAGRICNHFDFHGGGYTVDGACSSSLLAVVTACRSLRDRSADMVIAGGVDLSIDPFELVGFAKAGALTADRMRIYDERSAGFIPGEGCGVVVLMRAADARAAGLRAYSEIIGWGLSSDGSGGITRPERSGQLLALHRAYELAGVDPAEVRLIEGHGTGTAVGDETELSALAELRRGASHPAVLGSIKANIGHTKAASGMAGLIKTSLSVAAGVLPPTTGCEQPHPVLRAASDRLRVLSRPEPWPEGPRLAGVSSMGFGGINAHIALRSAISVPSREVRTPASRRPTPRHEAIILAADTVAELRSTLDRLAAVAPRFSEAELHDLACELGRTVRTAPCRAALVAATPHQLAERAALASARLVDLPRGTVIAADGIFLGMAVAGRVTVLLPGQGAPVRTDLGALGGLTNPVLPHHDATASAGVANTSEAQPAIYRGTMAALHWLQGLGVTPQAAIGHSLGEIAGLVWAGCLSEDDGALLVKERGRVMGTFGRSGTGMVSVAVDAAGADRLCAGTRLVIAGYNGPRSHVLAGPLPEVHEASARATKQGISAVVLPVSHAFHSAAMAGCVDEFKSCLRSTAFRPPAARVVSSVRGRTLTGRDDLAELLGDQLTAPVRFWDAVTGIAPDTDLFCEMGPGHSLSALITAGSSKAVVAVDVGAREDRGLADTMAALFVADALPDPAVAFADRPARPIDIWRDRVFLASPCSTAPPALPAESSTAARIVAVPPQAGGTEARTVATTVLGLVAAASELDAAMIDPQARLLSDLHLTSLRVTQLVVAAAESTGREHPVAPLSMADSSVAELISATEALPPAGDRPATTVASGLAPWIHCFTEQPQRRILRTDDHRDRHWRTHVAPGHRLSGKARSLFGTKAAGHGAGDGTVDLVYIPDPAAPDAVTTLLAAARAAVRSRRLVAITHSSALSGFLRSLRQEHPEVGVTLLRVPANVEALRVAARHATAEPASWRELVLDEQGAVSEPVDRALWQLTEGDLPLGRQDVVLVSGGGKGIGYECAAALAQASGVSLALLGRSSPEHDKVLRANLGRLREAGVRVAYEVADVTDASAVATGVRRLAAHLGPITGLLHASGINEPAALAGLDEAQVRAHLAPKVGGLRNLLAVLDQRRLRLLVTFGSVIGRFGLAGECHYALANGALRGEAERVAESNRGCRVLNLDWSIWSGVGMGEQLGVLDALLRLDVTPIPASEGVQLFLGLLRARDLPTTVAVYGRIGGLTHDTTTQPVGRFLDRVAVHHPGVELVADTDLDAAHDTYLGDHRIDGLIVLPAVVGLEAMAQAATALSGRLLRHAAEVSVNRPIVVPDRGTRTVRVCALRRGDVIDVALRSDESGYQVDHVRAVFPLAQPSETFTRPSMPEEDIALGGDELYGPVYFHTGRFRLVEEFRALGARHCHVRLRAPDGERDYPDVVDAPLLGELTSNDATVHALQACVPHRRLLPSGCEKVTVVPGTGAPREVYAIERHASNGEYVWDVVGLDRNGKRAITWGGLRLRDAGPLLDSCSLPAPLLAVYLERSALVLGLNPGLRVTITSGDRFGAGKSAAADRFGDPAAEVSRSYQGGLVLSVWARGRTACDWEAVGPRSDDEWRQAIGARSDAVVDQVRTVLGEPVSTVSARIRTAVQCLSKIGYPPSVTPVFAGAYEDGWVVFRAGAAKIASGVLSPAGAAPVAVAVLTTDAQADEDE